MNTDLKKLALVISYVGTKYCGWQRQTGSGATTTPSIQDTFEAALSKIFSRPMKVVASGRTDAGVHAVAQVVHFYMPESKLKLQNIFNGMNSNLPQDIRVHKIIEVQNSFHAQKSVNQKQYSYYFQQGPCALPHMEPYSWWIRKMLNINAMNEAVKCLIGEHDFKAFQARGSKKGSTVREIFEAEVSVEPVGYPRVLEAKTDPEFFMLRVRLKGSGFLKQMIRGISGTLLQIGETGRDPKDMIKLLKTLDRQDVGATAPGRALWLERIWYDEFTT